MVQLVLLRSEANFDIAQALSVGELGKCHAKKLIEAREFSHPAVALVLGHAAAKDW